jgi:glutamate synthase (NADPH/NADH) large chain
VALVLGSTGRNFAAGMSGGVAYVLDLDERLVNPAMVELAALDEAAVDQVSALLVRHGEETGSPVAATLLQQWPAAAARFTAVLPTDYRKVLVAQREAEAAGLDEGATTQAMMEAATRG